MTKISPSASRNTLMNRMLALGYLHVIRFPMAGNFLSPQGRATPRNEVER